MFIADYVENIFKNFFLIEVAFMLNNIYTENPQYYNCRVVSHSPDEIVGHHSRLKVSSWTKFILNVNISKVNVWSCDVKKRKKDLIYINVVAIVELAMR